MTAKEAKNIQRRYQRRGCQTWRTSHIYSGKEREGLKYWVHVLTPDGKVHTIHNPSEVLGGVRTTII